MDASLRKWGQARKFGQRSCRQREDRGRPEADYSQVCLDIRRPVEQREVVGGKSGGNLRGAGDARVCGPEVKACRHSK